MEIGRTVADFLASPPSRRNPCSTCTTWLCFPGSGGRGLGGGSWRVWSAKPVPLAAARSRWRFRRTTTEPGTSTHPWVSPRTCTRKKPAAGSSCRSGCRPLCREGIRSAAASPRPDGCAPARDSASASTSSRRARGRVAAWARPGFRSG